MGLSTKVVRICTLLSAWRQIFDIRIIASRVLESYHRLSLSSILAYYLEITPHTLQHSIRLHQQLSYHRLHLLLNHPSLFSPEIHDINALNLLVHGGNSLVMLCELIVTAHPIRMAHALYGAGAGLAYGVFSALYWVAGGTDRVGLPAIYPALDWNKPGMTVLTVIPIYCLST